MTHVDHEHLALLALGESGEGDDRAHLATCATCRASVEDLERVVAIAATIERDDLDPPAPPTRVWQGIERAVEASSSPQAATEGEARGGAGAPAKQSAADRSSVVAWPGQRARRHRRWTSGLAVAASVATLFVFGAILWQQQQPTAGQLVADTTLEPLAAVTSGHARLLVADDAYHLEVAAPDLPEPDGFYALWLIDADVAGMVNLGPLEDGRTYRLPAGFDPSAYPVVDVSIEPFDGDPTHSGNSVLRGVLPLES